MSFGQSNQQFRDNSVVLWRAWACIWCWLTLPNAGCHHTNSDITEMEKCAIQSYVTFVLYLVKSNSTNNLFYTANWFMSIFLFTFSYSKFANSRNEMKREQVKGIYRKPVQHIYKPSALVWKCAGPAYYKFHLTAPFAPLEEKRNRGFKCKKGKWILQGLGLVQASTTEHWL